MSTKQEQINCVDPVKHMKVHIVWDGSTPPRGYAEIVMVWPERIWMPDQDAEFREVVGDYLTAEYGERPRSIT